ncbi:SCP2 sterol-binding domain-containing protein [Micromonospora psammae]|uniref:SCP2 sterol-binding domain-containing protein n=1 Tax=Micromonospora sp. CPCC 205556 TaxID=3122398 RepID=UPI002FF0A7E7
MASPVTEQLERLDPARRPDLPETTAGTLRLDLRDDGHTEHWYLTIHDQRVTVSRSAEEAELVVSADRSAFDRLATGQTHVAAALVRNEISVRGDMRLLMALRRIFPGPAGARHPRELGRRRDGHR